MDLMKAQSHLVTIVADKQLADFDVTCSCGWLGGSHLFVDLAEKSVKEHHAEISAQSQQIRDLIGDILAAAQYIEWQTGDSELQVKAESIIDTVVKLSALVPVTEEHE